MKIHELIGKRYVVGKFDSVTIPDCLDLRGRIVIAGGKKIPNKKLMITKVSTYYPNCCVYVYYNIKGEDGYAVMPWDMEVTVMKRSKLYNDWTEHMLKNLGNHIHYSQHVGSDPEIFVEDENGQCLPAFDFLGSKKDTRVLSTGIYGNHRIYWDGFQAEFETTAIYCLGWHVDSVQGGLDGLYKALIKHNKKGKISCKTVMDISPEALKNAKPEHITFGCMPSFNAYDMKGLAVPGEEVPFRSAGGHIHFGIGNKTKAEYIRIVKALDSILGVACVSLFAEFDDPRRRTLYGLAGEYRTPAHGLEYRVLSNAWLFHPLIMNIVFDLARRSVMMGDLNLMSAWKATEKETIDIINSCDVDGARRILADNKALLVKILTTCYNDVGRARIVYNIFLNGMETAVKDPSDIVGNWNLNGRWQTHSDGVGKNVSQGINILADGKKVA